MAEYIERTEDLILAMNAGARAIENTKRYHGAVYSKDVFSESPQEIPYLQAAKVLREVSDAPAADVASSVLQHNYIDQIDELKAGMDCLCQLVLEAKPDLVPYVIDASKRGGPPSVFEVLLRVVKDGDADA